MVTNKKLMQEKFYREPLGKIPLRIRVVFGTLLILLLGISAVFVIVRTVITDLVHENVVSNARREAYFYSTEIDNWFEAFISQIESLERTLPYIDQENYQSIIDSFVEEGAAESLFVAFDDARFINSRHLVPAPEVDVRQRPWYLNALAANGEIAITDPYRSLGTGLMSVSISKMIPDLHGHTAVVGAIIPMNYIVDFIGNFSMTNGRYFYLLTGVGEVIVCPKSETDNTIKYSNYGEVMLGAMNQSEEVVEFRDRYHGQSYLNFRRLEELGWYLVSQIPTNFIEDQVASHTNLIMLLVTILLVTLGIIILYFITKMLTGFEEKKALQERFKLLLDQSPIACILFDDAYNIMDINQKGRDYYLMKDSDPKDYNLNHLSPQYQPDGKLSENGIAKHLDRAKKYGFTNFEWVCQTVTQRPRPSEVTLVTADFGGLTHNICYVRDMRREKEIVSRLEYAREEALKISEQKSYFLANMSHEIRTPINVISGMAAIGKSSDNGDRKDYAFEKISGASNHLLGIVNDILDMAKIEAGKLELNSREFDFDDMIQNALDVTSLTMTQKWQKLTVDLDPDLPERVMGDQQLLTQVLTNLLSNAAKFTDHAGSIVLRARLLERYRDRFNLQIQVSDTGCGIEPAKLKAIFNPFEQDRSQQKSQIAGTGLGLAICKRIIELCGGQIWAESVVGAGTTVSFNLTLRGTATKTAPLTGLTVGIISEQPEVCLAYSKHLEKSGAACLKLDPSQQPEAQVYLIDCEMEHHDGMDLARQLKNKYPKAIVLPIISSLWIGLEQTAADFGVDEILIAPMLPTKVNDAILRHLDKHQELSAKCPSTQQRHTDFTGRRILLAEDFALNREIISAFLENTGIQLEFAENGAEAVSKYMANPNKYDLIFMDLQMPVMDGLTASIRIQQLMKSGLGKQIPIIAMTANALQTSIDSCLEAGMADYLTKPLSHDIVMEKLEKYLGA